MSSEIKNQPGKSEKKNMQITQQVFHNLIEVVELYPQYKIAQHLSAILRRKSSDGPEFFHWSNEELLKRIEQHKTDLEGDQLMNESEQEY